MPASGKLQRRRGKEQRENSSRLLMCSTRLKTIFQKDGVIMLKQNIALAWGKDFPSAFSWRHTHSTIISSKENSKSSKSAGREKELNISAKMHKLLYRQ